jgi:large subunit ribosomal protein L23
VSTMDRMYVLAARPVITEKGSMDQADRNAYHFRVPVDANKVEVRQAIERVFEVKVKSVNTLHVKGKNRRRGWVAGKRPDWKKALVTLQEGHTIDVL